MKRLRERSQQAGLLLDATAGRKTRSLIVLDSRHVVLSALAQASTVDANESRAAFAVGASQLKLIESQLVFDAEPFGFTALDAALDKLAKASGPIKQRTLLAAAHVVSANGSVSVPEIELLRATAAALDVPLPPSLAQ